MYRTIAVTMIAPNERKTRIAKPLLVAFFMHMIWERLALVYAIMVPPLVIGVLILLMALEADYVYATRDAFFAGWDNFFQIAERSH